MDARQLSQKFGWMVLALLMAAPARAQTVEPLALFAPVSGSIENGETQSWSFTAASDAVLSFRLEATSGDLDPLLEIANSDDQTIIGNDDYNYPDSRDALLEAIAIPRTDTYTVYVSGFSGTAGDYTLTMLTGFGEVEVGDNFNGDTRWQATGDGLEVDVANGNMLLALAGAQQAGIALNRAMLTTADLYAQVHVAVIDSQSGWIVGMTARQQDDDRYYLLTLRDSGEWRFEAHTPDGEQVIRDWTTHPALVPGRTDFTLGILAQGVGFDFFYNGQLFGQVVDSTLADEGRVGLAVATTPTLTSTTVAQFDDLAVTVPLQVDGANVIPQQLIVSSPQTMARELQHRHVIPAGGEMALTVDESFVESSRPGVQVFMLGRGETYRDFALGTRVTWQSLVEGPAGCGLIVRASDDVNYTLAYIDQTGGFGVSQRENDTFLPGIFGENSLWSSSTQHLLVIVNDNLLYYYIDGQYVGRLDNPAIEGAIGNAVVNFEPIHTSCRFDETWLWRWDS